MWKWFVSLIAASPKFERHQAYSHITVTHHDSGMSLLQVQVQADKNVVNDLEGLIRHSVYSGLADRTRRVVASDRRDMPTVSNL